MALDAPTAPAEPLDLLAQRAHRAQRTTNALDRAVVLQVTLGVIAVVLCVLATVGSENPAFVVAAVVCLMGTWLSTLGVRWARDVLALMHSAEVRAGSVRIEE